MENELGYMEPPNPDPKNNWAMIALCACVLLALLMC